MIYCHVRYVLNMRRRREFEEYARIWVDLIGELGGTHLGYFLPSNDERADDHDRFSFPDKGAQGPRNVAVAIYSFPDWRAYEFYRSEAGKREACKRATRIAEESQCFTSYERTFMTRIP